MTMQTITLSAIRTHEAGFRAGYAGTPIKITDILQAQAYESGAAARRAGVACSVGLEVSWAEHLKGVSP